MRTSIFSPAAVLFVLALSACGMPPPGAMMSPGFAPARGPVAPAQVGQKSKCDPSQCHDYCGNAGCVFGEGPWGATCMAVCKARCGDGTFDEEDAAVMACAIEGGPDLECRPAKACCDQQITAQICAE